MNDRRNAPLYPLDWRIVKMRAQGLTHDEIGAALGFTESTVRQRLKKLESRKALREAFAVCQKEAVDCIRELLRDEDPRMRLCAAKIAFPSAESIALIELQEDDDMEEGDVIDDVPTETLLAIVEGGKG